MPIDRVPIPVRTVDYLVGAPLWIMRSNVDVMLVRATPQLATAAGATLPVFTLTYADINGAVITTVGTVIVTGGATENRTGGWATGGPTLVPANHDIFIEFTSGDLGSGGGGAGFIEIERTSGAITTALCTLDQVKAYANITTTNHDTLLTQVIAFVSDAIQSYLGREILSTTVVDKIDGWSGSNKLPLNRRPVVADGLETLRLNGEIVDKAGWETDHAAGLFVGTSNGQPFPWQSGSRNYEASYTAGWLTVPDAINGVAVRASTREWKESAAGDNRVGVESKDLQSGGTTTYEKAILTVDEKRTLANWRRDWA